MDVHDPRRHTLEVLRHGTSERQSTFEVDLANATGSKGGHRDLGNNSRLQNEVTPGGQNPRDSKYLQMPDISLNKPLDLMVPRQHTAQLRKVNAGGTLGLEDRQHQQFGNALRRHQKQYTKYVRLSSSRGSQAASGDISRRSSKQSNAAIKVENSGWEHRLKQ